MMVTLILTAPPHSIGFKHSKVKNIDEMKDKNSDIHLYVSQYTITNWKGVNFNMIREKHASPKYKLSNFRENVKRILKNLYNKTGYFKIEEDAIDPWYTSANNVSAAYKLLWFMYMDPRGQNRKIDSMPVEQIWRSHPKFQQCKFESFKKWNSSMKKYN